MKALVLASTVGAVAGVTPKAMQALRMRLLANTKRSCAASGPSVGASALMKSASINARLSASKFQR